MVKLFPLVAISVVLWILPRTEDPDTASLGGRVTDESNAPIAAARISVRNKFSGDVEIVRSDEAGLYRIGGLRQGRYSVFAQAEGHGCTWVLDVILFRGKHTNLDLILTGSRKTTDDCMDSIRSAQ
jgi:hypothetical protein